MAIKQYKGQWKKGDKVSLGSQHGAIVEVVDDGEYVPSAVLSVWYYKVRREDGRIDCIYPCVGDQVVQ